MNIRYHVELSEAERCELTALVGSGKHYARKIKRAQILLAADSGLSDDDIAAAVAVGGSTVYRTKRRFVEGNLEAALNEEPRAGADRKLTSNEEALLIATACSSPPEGRARWTLELLAGAMVELTDHDSLSRETIRRRLAENHLKPWQKDMWCIPKVDAEYVARMEAISWPCLRNPAAISWAKFLISSRTAQATQRSFVTLATPRIPYQLCEKQLPEWRRRRALRRPWALSSSWPKAPRQPAPTMSSSLSISARLRLGMSLFTVTFQLWRERGASVSHRRLGRRRR